LNIRFRTVTRITLKPVPSYTVSLSFADDPLRTVDVTVPIKARVYSKMSAQKAALEEMRAMSDVEIAVLVHQHLHPRPVN
jgi:hypothetical protein